MSNIHGLNEYRNENPGGGGGYGRIPGGPGGQQPQMDPEAQEAANMFGGLAGGTGNQAKDPRSENFWDMWKFTFCPNFSPNSFTFYLTIVLTIMYIMELVFTFSQSDRELNSNVFLGPDPRTLNTFGAKNPY